MPIDPVIGALLAGSFALLWAGAALHKLRDLGLFVEAFAAYRIVPPQLARLAALVPFMELSVACLLLPVATRPAAALAGTLLLLLYAGALALNLARGRRDLSCGCGGPNDKRPIAPWMVWRNLLLALISSLAALPALPRALGAADALTIGGGTAALAFLYMSLDTLLGRVAPRTQQLRGAA
jgi:hypothetical protein